MLLKVIINGSQGKNEDDKKLRNYYKEANDHVWKTDNKQRLQSLDGCFNVGKRGWDIREVDFA
jgi:hypothetical protein